MFKQTELKEELSRSQYESKLLREKLVHTERELGALRKTNQPTPKVIPDDMYQRFAHPLLEGEISNVFFLRRTRLTFSFCD